jgi:hypothetical protein
MGWDEHGFAGQAGETVDCPGEDKGDGRGGAPRGQISSSLFDAASRAAGTLKAVSVSSIAVTGPRRRRTGRWEGSAWPCPFDGREPPRCNRPLRFNRVVGHPSIGFQPVNWNEQLGS